MLPPTPVESLAFPAPAPESPRPAFPWIATIAPVVVSLVLWAVTGSPFGLMFAALGPVVAVGGVIDGRRTRRRNARRESERFGAAVARVEQAIGEAHERERARLRDLVSRRWDSADPSCLPVRLGTGEAPGIIRPTGVDPEVPEHRELSRLVAAIPRAPVVVDAMGGIGIIGPPVLSRAVARSLTVQLAARLSPESARLAGPPGEGWIAALPHRTSTGATEVFAWDGGPVIAWAEDAAGLPAGCASQVDVTGATALSADQVRAEAAELSARAAVLGLSGVGMRLPDTLSWDEVVPADAGPGLSATIGRTAAEVVTLDLVADGPHALVAGTTGSGKSELLVTWVLGMAYGRSPTEVTFLLIDFKGGAAFAPLAGLPHVVATLSDLDARLTHRAVESLRAELLRRERSLAGHGARSIDALPPGVLPRLVVVVDEFAALVADRPELHDVVADLAARGRSLGMHLILCTQRPAGVVRDAVLANIGLRISLRVADRADSIAMLGDDTAARIPAAARGRAIVVRPSGSHEVQIALSDVDATTRVSTTTDAATAVTPWCDPLPAHVDLDALPPVSDGLAFGLADLPAELRQPVAVHDPKLHGHLLVTGAAGAGATTLLTTLAESARRRGLPVDVMSPDPADAWAQLTDPGWGQGVVLIDGLDLLLGRLDADARHEFVERVSAVLRAPSAQGSCVIASVRRLSGAVAAMTGLFGARVILRQSSRDDHLLAGGAHGEWDPGLPPGAGTWREQPVQVAQWGAGSLPPPRVRKPLTVSPGSHPVLAVVATRPRGLLDALRASGARVVQIGRDAPPESGLQVSDSAVPTVMIGDPDAWLSDWNLLTTARRDWPLVLIGCTASDHRSLLRDREPPPLLGPDPLECWFVSDGRTERARLEL